jgi:RNA polymerase sigma-70 factor (ECF subfamily)
MRTERSTETPMPDGTTAVHPDDVALLAALRLGDGDAAARVMQRHNRALWRIARGILKDDGEAEDAVQDTWLRAFGAAAEYRGEASLGTWLARIAINEALRRANRHKATVELDPIVDLLPAEHPGSATMSRQAGPEHAAAHAEIRRMVEQAIDTLPPSFRVVFMMRVVEQMSIDATSVALGLPAATVKTRLHRANERLRAALGGAFAAVLDDSFPFGGARCARLTTAVLARLRRDGPTAPPRD